MTDFKLIEDFMKEARQYPQPMNELTKEAEAWLKEYKQKHGFHAGVESAVSNSSFLKAQQLYTRDEIINAAKQELLSWKADSKWKKWTSKDFEYLGFVSSVMNKLSNPEPLNA